MEMAMEATHNPMQQPASLKTALEAHLASVTADARWQTSLYAPMAYILGLGGKRIRPMLLLMSYQAMAGRDGREALNCAMAVEFFHNFSLIHDDIMDNAPMRRGKPTVHAKWNSNTAILSGDAMFALAYDFLVRDFPGRAAPLLHEFTRVAVGVCEGQMEDMEMAGKPASIPQYMEMIRKKTAMLIGGSLSLGGIAAGASEAEVQQLYQLGETAGIGFQLHDDYLDAYAPVDKFGKQVGGDILENKMTFLLIRCMEKADSKQRTELDRLLHHEKSPEAKVAGVMGLYAELGIEQETKAEMGRHFAAAEQLAQTFSSRPGFEWITAFLQSLSQRDH
jgi:geranylgeranyl diphosphate synthase, type II